MAKKTISRFHKFSLSTLVAVYFLIMVGGVVRSTGSGMGCPDWPKCFGQWIPPSSVKELPTDYKEKYSAIREKKNQKFAKVLAAFGFKDTAGKILADKTILVEADFSPLKSWIEYVNRLVGVVIGFFIIVLAYRSIGLRTRHPWIFRISVATLITVMMQGWFGSIVVSTNLTTWTVTIHMFLALAIVVMLTYLLHASSNQYPEYVQDKGILILTIACMVILLVQIFLGTELRAAIDRMAAIARRSAWIAGVGEDFVIHRSFSWLVLLLHAILIGKIRKTAGQNPLTLYVIVLILGAFVTGVGMAYFGVPAFLQPLHLLLSTMAFGAEVMLFFKLSSGAAKKIIHNA